MVGSSKRNSVGLAVAATAHVPSRLEVRQMADEFQPLAFAAGKGVDRLAETQITQADFLQQLQAGRGALRGARIGEAGEKIDGFIHGGVEQIGDATSR